MGMLIPQMTILHFLIIAPIVETAMKLKITQITTTTIAMDYIIINNF